MQEGEREKAIDQFKKVKLTHPGFSQGDLLLFFTGECYIDLGKPALAKGPPQQLIVKYPNSSLKAATEKMLKDLQDQGTPNQGTSKQGPSKQ
jgi:hypothetical protein